MPGFGSNNVQSPQRQMALLSVTKTGGASPVLGGLCASFCSIVDLGVGSYKINVNIQRPFSNGVQVVAMPHTPGHIVKDVSGGDASDNLQIKLDCFAVDGTTPAELNFDLMIVGSFARDLIGA